MAHGRLCQEYRFLENGEERLRIGTVDAFQGMEFDIVFSFHGEVSGYERLAASYTQRGELQKETAKLFGHLMSEKPPIV